MPNNEILSRMIFLRDALPRCNVARMVSLAPRSIAPTCYCHSDLEKMKDGGWAQYILLHLLLEVLVG